MELFLTGEERDYLAQLLDQQMVDLEASREQILNDPILETPEQLVEVDGALLLEIDHAEAIRVKLGN